MGDVTQLLAAASTGDETSRESLFAAIYAELTKLARARLSRESTLTDLDAGSLVQEACIRLVKQGDLPSANRRVFYGYASSVMRSVIVDYVRHRNAAKRGSGVSPVTLVTRDLGEMLPGADFEALNEALDDLRRIDERCARLVEMRFFGGMEFDEIALTLDVSRSTVSRDWDKSRAFLYQALSS